MSAAREPERVTPRMVEACVVLAQSAVPESGVSPSGFAMLFWGRDKHWGRGSNNYGLQPDASGWHGGKMLNRLRRAGLVHFNHGYGYYTATLTAKGRALAQEAKQ